jgi:hypothetical protein
LRKKQTNDDGEQEQEQECSSSKSHHHHQPDNSLLKKLTPYDILNKKNPSTEVTTKEETHKKVATTITSNWERWTDAEDKIFLQRVKKYVGLNHQPKKWIEITSHIEGKTPKQCKDHCYYKLKKYKKK